MKQDVNPGVMAMCNRYEHVTNIYKIMVQTVS